MSTDQSAGATPTTSMTTSSAVATTILQQLGRLTLAMMGALEFSFTSDSLTFKIRGSKEVSHIVITLTPLDTYTVKFEKRRAGTVKDIATDEDVYADDLHQIIASRTGLATGCERVKPGA